MDEKKFVTFAEEIIRMKDEVKGINGDIAEAIEEFSDETGLNKKSTKKAIADYIWYRKNAAEFQEVDLEVASILEKVVYKELN